MTARPTSSQFDRQVRTVINGRMRPETNGNNLQNRSERSRIRVFVRQPFTESGNTEKEIIQGALDVLGSLDVDVITGLEAQSQDTFRTSFEKTTGMPFTPGNFRAARLGLLQAADAMVFIRTSLSESGAFEAAYNVYAGRRVPMFFAIWKHAPIKTTLLRDLDEFCTAEYVTFETPEELRSSLTRFLIRAGEERPSSSYQIATAADTVVRLPALDPDRQTRRLRAKAVRHGLPH